MASSRALTRAHTLMKLLSPRVAAPFSVRALSSATLRTTRSKPNSDSKSDKESEVDFDSPSGSVSQLVNRLLKEATVIPYLVMKDNEAMYARLDVPGIGKDGLEVWVDGNALLVYGEEEEEKGFSPLADECGRRRHYGNIDIPQSCYNLEEIEAELKNGVLRVKIPKRDIINVKVN